MAKMTKAAYEKSAADRKQDRKAGVKEGSKRDNARDAAAMRKMAKGKAK